MAHFAIRSRRTRPPASARPTGKGAREPPASRDRRGIRRSGLDDRAAVIITHAGANTVLDSISRAVPMVALPRSADQPAMGSRIVHAGVGLRGSFWHSSARHIRRLVQEVLAEDTFWQRAKKVQKAMIAAGGVSRAADIVEEAFSTRRPVIRRGEIGNGQHASEPSRLRL